MPPASVPTAGSLLVAAAAERSAYAAHNFGNRLFDHATSGRARTAAAGTRAGRRGCCNRFPGQLCPWMVGRRGRGSEQQGRRQNHRAHGFDFLKLRTANTINGEIATKSPTRQTRPSHLAASAMFFKGRGRSVFGRSRPSGCRSGRRIGRRPTVSEDRSWFGNSANPASPEWPAVASWSDCRLAN